MPKLSDKHLELLRGRNFGIVATVDSAGRPQTSVVWVDTDGEHDRERLDPFDTRGQKRRDDDERAQSSIPWSKMRFGETRTITRSTGAWNCLP